MARRAEPSDRLGRLSPEQRAALLRRLGDQAMRRAEAAAVPRRQADGPAPLSFAQERLWFLDRLNPGTATYTMARALRLRGPLAVPALARGVAEIVRRHESLRTAFAETAAGPVQVAGDPGAGLPLLPIVDLGALPAARREEEVASRAAGEARRPFELARGPLLRPLLLRVGDDDHVFVLTLHHVAGDGWSFGVLDRELAALYGAFAAGRPSPLPDLPLQYADFACWQRRWLAGDELGRLLGFWRERLAGAPAVLALPLDRPRPAAPSHGGARVRSALPAGLVTWLKALARREKATPFMVFLAAFQALLSRWSGQADLCVGIPVAGRTRLETEPLIGCFANTLVLRGDLSGDPPLQDLLRRVRGATGEALAHQELPFEKLVEELRPERDPALHPLVQVMFDLQGSAPVAAELPGLRSELVDFETGATPFDLTLILAEEADGGMEVELEYATDLFDRATAERMAEHYRTLLAALATDPERRLAAVALDGLEPAVRRAEPATVAPAPPAPWTPPRSATEWALARLWAGLLGPGRVGVHDNFFAAGGHSLLALQLLSRVREELGVDLPVRRFFERPTIAGLAESLDAATHSDVERIEPAPRQGPAPLSFAQHRLWFIDQLQPGSPVYNVPVALRLRGRLDAGALAHSLDRIAGRHEALRTVFPLVDGEPVQALLPAVPLGPALVDLGGLPEPGRGAEARRLAAEEARAPFDLARGPLVHARLLRLAGEDHVLLLTLHHIVGDGWSLGVLLRELEALYAGAVLPPLPIQYADYAVWERGRLQGERIAAEVDYWRDRLAGAPAALELPADRPRPQVATRRGAWRPFRLPAGPSAALKALALGEGATLFAALLAAFQALLGRYTGQDDLCVGTPVAGRNRLELEGLIGCFVNTLVLRGDLSGDPGFRELVRRAREAAAGAQAHQELPFERMLELLSLPRDLARQPLFQVAVVLQNLPFPELRLPGLAAEHLETDTGTSKFDLTMQFEEAGDGLAGSVEYSTDLFDAATVDRLVGHFQTLVAGAAAAPDRRLSELPLLTAGERRELLAAGQRPLSPSLPHEGGGRPLPRDGGELLGHEPAGALCLHEIFAAQVRRDAGAPAVTWEGESLSYGELEVRARRVARLLRARGVGPETRVGVCLDRSPDLAAAILGTLQAGGAYVPLDPAYPRERLAFILADAEVRVVLTRERLRASLPEGIDLDCIDLDGLPPGPEDAAVAGPEVDPDHPAYVLYTSGSTGQPKGVVVTHRNVARLFAATRPRFGFGPDDVWTLFHSAAFDFSVWEMWGALLHGGRLVVVPFAVSRSPEAFLDLLRRERVTVLNQTPSAFRLLLHADRASAEPGGLPALRLVIFGGEALAPADLGPWFERHGDGRPLLVNMYGITETTVHVTCRPLRAADAGHVASPLGGPLADLRLHLLDRSLEPVPYGAAGEIYVGGAGLARGYWRRPHLTAERFVPDPFGAPGERLYRSGDLARRRADGEVEYLGRADDQVKIRGFRVEPGEIEATLGRCPGVLQAAVAAREESPGERRLVAYVVPAAGEPATIDALRLFLLERLPEHMVPGTFIFLAALPATPSGKLDRRALPAPGRSRPGLEQGYVPPRTATEKALAEVWSAVLGLAQVGADDNFFALGGDSIRSLQVKARAAERGLGLSLQQIFAHQTIRGLAADLARALPEEPRDRPEPFDLIAPEDRRRLPADVEDAYPLSRLQEGFVFHSEYSPDYIVYVSSVEIRAPFLRDRLEAVVRRLVERQAILRTSFDLRSFGEPLQLVHRAAEIPLAVDDLTALPPAGQDRALAAWVAREMRRRFDWTRRPLARLHVHLLGEARFQLTLTEPFFDGWSVASFLTELLVRYNALLHGEAPPPEPPLRSSYRDFVALERAAVQSPAVRDFWAGKLADATATRLPRREGARRDPGALPVCRVDVPVPPETSAALQRLAGSAGAPLKSVLLAAQVKVVSLLAGRREVVTGLIANGRPEEPDGDKVLGIFLNTLPFRLLLAGGSWADLARRAFLAEREMLPYRRFPMAELQRMSGGQLLYDTAFNYTNFHVYRQLDLRGGLDLWGGYGFEQTYFALTTQFNLDEFSGQISLALDHRSADLTEEEAREIAGRFTRVLAAMAEDPLARHEAFDGLTGEERRRVLAEWNDTRRDYPLDRRVHDLFAAQAARTPDAVAVVDAEGTARLTYRGLDRRANQVAHRLRRLGAGPEALVALCLRRSPDLIVGLLGILKAGGAYVPLDPAYPRERLAFMLEDTRAPVLITEQDLLAAFPPHAARVLCLDRDREALDGEPTEEPDGGAFPGSLAYVIYTSGSTGRPKGAAVEHWSTVSLLHWAREIFAAEELSGMLASSSVCFDSSVLEIFAPLAWGGTIILAENALHLPALPARDAVRLVNTVPSAVAELVRLGGLPAPVRTVSLAGEALPSPLVQRIYAATTVERVVNLYGLSEATVYTTLAAPRRDEAGATPIGRPIANTRVYLVGEDLDPVAPGVPGEICVGGVGPGRGYVNRPELTAERFVPDPFGGEPGARLYRTGDLGRCRPDGTIDFLGRIDQQVKLRGFRIEPGEIEAVLSGHPAVAEAVVQVREERDGDRRLVAYVVAKTGPPAPDELRRHLAGRLPEPMVPSSFVFLAALPRTPNGKLDRKALPAPARASAGAAGAAHVPPVTPDEKKLARLWSRVLQVEQVGLDDNFFAAGGHSLLATRLLARLREAFQVELSMRALFDAPTVAGLVRAVERARSAGGGRAVPALRRVPRDRPLPLSFAQQRLWFLDQLEPGSAFYNIPAALRLRGALDTAALRRALHGIVRRHEALRTTFQAVLGEPAQVVAPAMELALPIADLGRLPEGAREDEARRLTRDDARAAFDLQRGPLVRAALLRLGGDDHLLLLTTHHIVSDGWSLQVLLRELAHLYRGLPLPELEIQYADFACWQRQRLDGDLLGEQLDYWKRHLAGAPAVLDLPADRPRPPAQSYRGAHHPFAFPRELGQALQELGRREGVTLFMTLLAGFEALLHRYTGAEAMLVGSPVAGRDRVETEGLIGFFANTLVLRGDLAGDPSFRELLARTREAALGAFAHQDLPFEKLVEALQPERDLSRAPLFQVMFALQPPAEDVPELPGLTLRLLEVDSGTSQFDLTLSIAADDEGLAGTVEYRTDLFDGTRIARLAGHLAALLRAAAADPERRVSGLPLLAPAERQILLREWRSAGDGAAAALPTVLDRFAMQAAGAPGAPAVICGDERLTYGELERRATRLARRLRALGVGPEVPVAICLERSVDLVAGILGILQAGGAYVPLDPAYPRERLDFVLRDTAAPVLVTRRRLASSLRLSAPRVVCLDSSPDCDDTAPLERRPAAGDLAYVLYTSGSTGRPKGVAVAHGSLACSTAARLEVYREPVSSLLLLPSCAFDSSVAGIFWTLSTGGTLVLPPDGREGDPRELLALIGRQRVSHWLSVPSLYAYLLAQARPEDLAPLRTVVVAGETCPPELVARHRALAPGAALFNEYGPTEATVWSTVHEVVEDAPAAVPIGRPLPRTSVYLLDPALEPAPPGVPGELHVGGDGVARGYLGRPGLTAGAFVPDPWSGAPGARLYRTGDLARFLPDGALQFLGRADHQVKVRGYRIEPGEVEAVLAQHVNVRQSAVVVQEPAPGDLRLVAFVVPEPGEVALAGDLRAFLKQRLPPYMVPAAIVPLDALPLNPNGKVDRRALRALPVERAGRAAGDALAPTPPRDDLERRLAAIWEEVLNVRPIGIHESFFDLGGHSLLTVPLMARVEREFGRRLPLSTLFRDGTIAALADRLRGAAAPALPPPLVALSNGGARPPFYCVHPLGGTVLCYGALARRLGSARPFYALEATGLRGEAPPETSVEGLATRYLEAVRGHRERGPYLLGGWSFGGVVAYEMACRLAASGERVTLLLLDSRAPGSLPVSIDPADTPALVTLLERELGDTGSEDIRGRLDVLRAHLQALQSYRPGSYPGRTTLLRAAGSTTPDLAHGWRTLTADLEVHEVPGDHYSMVREPHVRVLAETLEVLLR